MFLQFRRQKNPKTSYQQFHEGEGEGEGEGERQLCVFREEPTGSPSVWNGPMSGQRGKTQEREGAKLFLGQKAP